MTKLSREKTFPLFTIFNKLLKFPLLIFKSFARNSKENAIEYAKFVLSSNPQMLSLYYE